jgi:prevent-host-death family protein
MQVGEHAFVHDPNHKGNVAELAIATEAAKLGLSVLKPLTEHERYDLALGIGDGLLRVQCKWGSCKSGVICVCVSSSYHSPTRGYVKSTYDASEIDAVAVYWGDLHRCYLLPVEMVAGRQVLHLRTAATRNNQRAAVNYAADYDLGAVAQGKSDALAARRSRVRIPPAPLHDSGAITPESPGPDGFAQLKDTVGMDQFYARLAHYVRRAEGGEEVVITRWGRPVARLAPVGLNQDPVSADD